MNLRRRGATALATILLSGCLLSSAHAADKEKKADKDRRPFQGMTSELLLQLDQKLSLTDDQKEQIVSLKQQFEEKHRDELRGLRERTARISGAMEQARKTNNPAAHRRAQQEIRELRMSAERLRGEFERGLLNILDDDQRQQYETLKKELEKPGRFKPGKK
jgi:Spy/CpxP family protein refolding chaperone